MTFDYDYTSPGYNSYSDVPTVDGHMEFLEAVNGTIGWDEMDEITKQAHIVNASASLGNYDFQGTLNPLVITPKNMQFPRSGLEFSNGNPVPSDEVPFQVKEYVACFVYVWISGGTSIGNNTQKTGLVSKKKVDEVEVWYDNDTDTQIFDYENNKCLDDYIPGNWITGSLSIGGVGSIRKIRTP